MSFTAASVVVASPLGLVHPDDAVDQADSADSAGPVLVPREPVVVEPGVFGAVPADLPMYGLDIETDTTIDGLDPASSAIVAVALSTADGDIVFLGDEADIISGTERALAALDPGVVVTWNGSAFDLPFLMDRAARCGVELSLRLSSDPGIGLHREPLPGRAAASRATWGHHAHIDGYLMYRADVGRSLGLPCGLKRLSRFLGLDPVEVDRSLIHELDDDAIREYVASDARLARELVLRRLPTRRHMESPVGRRPTGEWSPPEPMAMHHNPTPH
ncbi:MAG: 3'-5' exonuclease [Acidimicrobiales bacterium]